MAASIPSRILPLPISSIRAIYARAASSSRFVSVSRYADPPSGSAVAATPDSCASISCDASDTRIAASDGMSYASSYPLICSDCVPPSTAASACNPPRRMLFSGSCRTSVDPSVCVWNRIRIDSGRLALYRSRISRAHSRRAARNLAISSKKSLCTPKKYDSRDAKASTASPRPIADST